MSGKNEPCFRCGSRNCRFDAGTGETDCVDCGYTRSPIVPPAEFPWGHMDPMTHGKWLYLKHHLVGIRREVGSLIEADEGYAEEREAADELDTMIARVNRVLHECPRYTMPCALEISEE